jgi:hypothetical protein
MTQRGSASRSTRGFSRERLEDELGRVHALEFARLLGAAELLRRGRPDELVRWRRAARAACALAEVDGFEPPGLLRHALAHTAPPDREDLEDRRPW